MLTIVLENARLVAKNNIEHDSKFIEVYNTLKLLLDSPLNKSNKLKIYVHTLNNILIEFNYVIDIPSTLDDFNNLMLCLLKKLSIKADDGTVLARVIKNPISKYFSPNSVRIQLSTEGSKLIKEDIKPFDFEYVFFINLINKNEKNDNLSVKLSDFKLSIESCCIKLTSIFEELLNVF